MILPPSKLTSSYRCLQEGPQGLKAISKYVDEGLEDVELPKPRGHDTCACHRRALSQTFDKCHTLWDHVDALNTAFARPEMALVRI